MQESFFIFLLLLIDMNASCPIEEEVDDEDVALVPVEVGALALGLAKEIVIIDNPTDQHWCRFSVNHFLFLAHYLPFREQVEEEQSVGHYFPLPLHFSQESLHLLMH
jgi:hypothetical protein